MSNPLLLGLDIGTTHVKAIAYASDGTPRAEATRAYPSYYPQPGWVEQRPEDWIDAAGECLSEVVGRLGAEAAALVALGLSAHAPALVPVDAHGLPLIERVPIWQDERSVGQARSLLRSIGSEWIGLGMPYASFAAKLKWFTATFHELAKRARYAVGVKAYVAHWLTGQYATDASSEPGAADTWTTVCGACGWSLDRLPPLLPASQSMGELRGELGGELGLPRHLRIVLGLNDGGSATLGNGAYRPGDAVVSLATNGVIFLVSGDPIPADLRSDHSLFCWPFVDGSWIVGGQTKSGASSLGWLVRILEGDAAIEESIDRLLLAAAEVPPGCHGVRFLPYLAGRGTPVDDPTAKGAFTGLTLQTDRATMTRAVLEGVAFSLREVHDELVRSACFPCDLHITGGGARSPLWRQIAADVLDRPLAFSKGESCLGAAMLAGVGTGVFPSVEAACQRMTRAPQVTRPRPEMAAFYDGLFADHIRLRDAQAGLLSG